MPSDSYLRRRCASSNRRGQRAGGACARPRGLRGGDAAPDAGAVDAILSVFRPDVLQTDLADLAGLRLPAGLALLPVLRAGEPEADALPGTLPPRMLFEGARSGSGWRPTGAGGAAGGAQAS